MGSKSRIILTAFLVSVYLVEEIASEPRWGWSRRRRQCYKQNCVPGQWSKWSPCSHSCGPHGHSRATRPIIRPASCGGTCLVTTVAAKACNRFCLNGGTLIRSSCYCKSGYSGECCEKVSGGWTSWGSWCACSKTCGRGTQYRKRSCTKPGGTGCQGSSKEYRSCILKQCNLDGGWSSWSSWGQCTGSCGSGLQTRKRSCTKPPPSYGGKKCSGPAEQHKNCLLQRCPVNGGWSTWRPWSKCSKTCGDGLQYTNRYCNNPTPENGGKPCVGPSRNTRTCSIKSCAVDGGWSPWGLWCKCSKTCGTGSQYRTRSCTKPRPGYGGKPCTGPDKQTRICNTRLCPVRGGWSSWTMWGACSRTCGNGRQYSRRYCTNPVPKYGGRRCYGPSTRSRACNVKACPVNGRWSKWSAWSQCSRTCGYGSQTRRRTCTNPPPKYGGKCVGPSVHTKSCLGKRCLVNGRWAQWTRWSACSKTCGTGSQTRTRTCSNPPPQHGGKPCKGISVHTKSCLLATCPAYGGWGSWGAWSLCSKSCGTGSQRRKRTCKGDIPGQGQCPGSDEQTRDCNTEKCPVVNGGWGEWTQWSSCSTSCGPGTSFRTRRCDNPTPGPGGSACMGHSVANMPCDLGPCSGNCWGDWSDWSQCTKACGCGQKFRVRFCNCAYGQGHDQCQGPGENSQSCNCNACPNGPPDAFVEG